MRIMFIHVPAAWLAMFVYACLGGASFLALVFRHVLADAAAAGRRARWAPASPCWPWSPARSGAGRCGGPGGSGTRA